MYRLPPVLTVEFLLEAYRTGELTPGSVMAEVLARIDASTDPAIWISVAPAVQLRAQASMMDKFLLLDPQQAWQRYPLLGIPFAVKDNIDVAGLPTTAACPGYRYMPNKSADAVARLEAAGAIVIGKTNLDQFATGLVGTRSPYGAVVNPFNTHYISGGSSSGSAAATARGQVAFALGTDTAGSGRVPAGFCNLVGIKPTPGLVSNKGMVPACRSLDCVSIFSHTVADSWRVLSLIAGNQDGYGDAPLSRGLKPRGLVVGVPTDAESTLDPVAWAAYRDALDIVAAQPGIHVEQVDMAPFHQVAGLLYDGPWVAERRAALGDFFKPATPALDPIVASVISQADNHSAAATFQGQYRLAELRRQCQRVLDQVDLLLLPTTPTIFTHAEIAEAPVERNTRLGHYTNFVNLLGLSALALPGPFRADGLPAGITLVGNAGADHLLAETARTWESALHRRLGTTEDIPPRWEQPLPPLPFAEPTIQLAVVGAHLSGLPLHWQLLERGARLVEKTTTAPYYRFYALADTTPPKPGLARVNEDGQAIAVEVWELPLRQFGSFVADIPPPLGIGTVVLASGRQVKGFLCESAALGDAQDITAYGGWRAYLASPPSQARVAG